MPATDRHSGYDPAHRNVGPPRDSADQSAAHWRTPKLTLPERSRHKALEKPGARPGSRDYLTHVFHVELNSWLRPGLVFKGRRSVNQHPEWCGIGAQYQFGTRRNDGAQGVEGAQQVVQLRRTSVRTAVDLRCF